VGGKVTGDNGGQRDRAVAGGFVETHRQSTLPRPDEVDFHHHRCRPSKALVDAQQDVGEDHPSPRRRPNQQLRDRNRDQPAHQQHGFASEAI